MVLTASSCGNGTQLTGIRVYPVNPNMVGNPHQFSVTSFYVNLTDAAHDFEASFESLSSLSPLNQNLVPGSVSYWHCALLFFGPTTGAVPTTTDSFPFVKVAVTSPLPQPSVRVYVTRPLDEMVPKFCILMDQVTMLEMSFVSGGWM